VSPAERSLRRAPRPPECLPRSPRQSVAVAVAVEFQGPGTV